MNKIHEMIAIGYITFEDIEQYLQSINKEVIDTNRLMILENSFTNYPG